MPGTTCPDRDHLAAFVLGKLSDADLEAVSSHEDSCPHCQTLTESLDGLADTVVSKLRDPQSSDTVEHEPPCREMVARLQSGVDILARHGGVPTGETDSGNSDTGDRARPAAPQAFPAASDAAAASSDQPAPASLASIPPSDPAAAATTGQLGQYQLLEKLGSGGMGTVYKARHTKLKRLVAIKVLPSDRVANESAVARFHREMEAVATLDHPNIVRAYDAGEEAGTHFLVMEFVDGIDLSHLVKLRGPLPVADACELIRQAAVGLQHAHEHGLVHRDIKPSNLMLSTPLAPSAGRGAGGEGVKVLDLGLARLQSNQPPGEELTGSGQTMGTIDYMAPEQASDTHTVDIRADIYSLGCTLYHLLAGHPPFHGPRLDSPIKKMMAHAQSPIPSIRATRPDVPDGLVAVLDRMLAKSPADRFQTPADVARALSRFAVTSDLVALSIGKPLPAVPGGSPDLECGDLSPLSVASRDPDRAIGQTPTNVFSAKESGDKSPHSKARLAVGLVAAAVLLALGGVVYRISTDRGELVIHCHDEAVEVTIKRNGKPVVEGLEVSHGQAKTTVRSGDIEVLIRGDHADDFTVTSNQGGPSKFVLSRDGKAVVEIERKLTVAASPSTDADPDRRAAEWVLSIGGRGMIRVGENDQEFNAGKNIPAKLFQLVEINFTDNRELTDAKLERLAGLSNLTVLGLYHTDVSDAGLAQIRTLTNLTVLNLTGTRVSDAGLVHIEGLTNLTSLELCETKVSDKGLEHLKGLKNLVALYLRQTRVSDAGLEHLKGLSNLWRLDLRSTAVSDAGLQQLADLRKLAELYLDNTGLTDAGIEHIKGWSSLTQLDLRNTRVSDAGLEQLKLLRQLTLLYLQQSNVTAEGVKKLSAVLPGCKIEWDGGVIEPTAK